MEYSNYPRGMEPLTAPDEILPPGGSLLPPYPDVGDDAPAFPMSPDPEDFLGMEDGWTAGRDGEPVWPDDEIPELMDGTPDFPVSDIPLTPLDDAAFQEMAPIEPPCAPEEDYMGGDVPPYELPSPSLSGPLFPAGDVPPSHFLRSTGRVCLTRFLNAAEGYRPLHIALGNRVIYDNLGFSEATFYGRVSDGYQTVTIVGPNHSIYLQKSMPFRGGEVMTIAIVSAPNGLNLVQISDTPCGNPAGMSCFRVCNLVAEQTPLDIVLSDGRVVYSDVCCQDVTAYRRIRTGQYQFYAAHPHRTTAPRVSGADLRSRALSSFAVDVGGSSLCTAYLMGNSSRRIETRIMQDPL